MTIRSKMLGAVMGILLTLSATQPVHAADYEQPAGGMSCIGAMSHMRTSSTNYTAHYRNSTDLVASWWNGRSPQQRKSLHPARVSSLVIVGFDGPYTAKLEWWSKGCGEGS